MTRMLDQKRAAHAHAAAKAIAAGDKRLWEEYRRRVRSLPADIVTNGLGQALATLHKNANDDDAFKKQAYETLVKDINAWFAEAYPDSPMRGDPDLLNALVERDQGFYVWAQEESLLYLGWLKKLTEAYCGADHTQHRGDDE